MTTRLGGGVLVAAVFVVGLNLRGPLIAVSPVLTDIQRDLAISATSAGLLTSIPVVCFAAVAPLVAGFARKIGLNRAVAVSLLILTIGIAIRPWHGFGLMLGGTVFIGAAIAVGNVLMPVVIRRDFANRRGPMMSVVTTSLILSATIPAFLAVPLTSLIGWRAALAVWAVAALGALALWITATKHRRETTDEPSLTASEDPQPATHRVWRTLSAWELGGFFGLQSLMFYATTAWLPTMLRDSGRLDAAAAGTALSIFQLLGVTGALAIPLLIRRQPVRYAAVAALAVMWIVFFLGVLAAPGGWPAWCVLGGITQGGCLAMGLSLIAIRATSSTASRDVSTVVQTVGYTLGAIGPVVVGGVSTITTGWTAPFAFLIAMALALGLLGLRSVSARPIA